MSRKAIVIGVEGFGTNHLGCYGGSLCETPNLNRFASRAITFDQYWLDSVSLPVLYRSLQFGVHAARSESTELPRSIASDLSQNQLSSLLITDSAEVPGYLGANEFTECFLVEHTAREPASTWEDCRIASLLEQALSAWSDAEQNASLLWIHARGLLDLWDAPIAFREQLRDDEDPPVLNDIEPPAFPVTNDSDPELIFMWNQAAAAQAMVLDHAWLWLDSLLKESHAWDNCMVILMGLGGYPLGEHGYVGPLKSDLHSEKIHAPLIVRPGNKLPVGQHFNRIVQPDSIRSMLRQWLIEPTANESSTSEPRDGLFATDQIDTEDIVTVLRARNWPRSQQTALARHQQQISLITPSWSALWTDAASTPSDDHTAISNDEANAGSIEVYVNPEDRWQQNNIASRVPEVIDQLTQVRDELLSWYDKGQSTNELSKLDELLIEPVR